MRWKKTNPLPLLGALMVSLFAVSVVFAVPWVQLIFPQCQIDIISMLPLIVPGVIESPWLEIFLD
jgi:hypothetical protein